MEDRIFRANRRLITTAILLTAILQILLIFNYNVWNDEATTIIYILRDFKDLWGTIMVDDHPPLYYLLLKGLISVFGYRFGLVKLFSAVPIILMHIWTGALVLRDPRMRASRHAGPLATLFIVITTLDHNFLYLSTEIRMYSLAMFFVTMSGIYAFKVYADGRKRDHVILVLLLLGGAYTHHFATLSEAFICLFLFIFLLRRDIRAIRQVLFITGASFIGYLPWLPVLLGQIGLTSGEARVRFRMTDVRGYFSYIIENDAWIVMLLSVILLLAFYALLPDDRRTKEEKAEIVFGLLSISVVFLVMFTGIFVNLKISPVFMGRYLSPALGLFWLGFIVLAARVDHRRIVVLLLGGLIVYKSLTGYTARLITEYDTGTQNIVQAFNEMAGPEDYIVTNNEHLRISVLGFYFPGHLIRDIEDIDFEEDEIDRPVWYFEDTQMEEDKEYIEAAGYQCRHILTGDFDNTYYFRLYLIGRKPEENGG